MFQMVATCIFQKDTYGNQEKCTIQDHVENRLCPIKVGKVTLELWSLKGGPLARQTPSLQHLVLRRPPEVEASTPGARPGSTPSAPVL